MKISDRTKRKFKKNVEFNECWLWKGAKDHRGYGRFYVPELQQNVPAHRLLYKLKNGSDLTGLEVHHECRVRSCVRPSHLRLVTHKENSQLAAEAGSWSGEKSGRTIKKEVDIIAIILLYEDLNIPAKTIAKTTEIPLRTVYSYIKREAWTHLKIPETPSERDEFLRKYFDGDLPVKDSPYSCHIRSLIKRRNRTSDNPLIDIWDGDVI